MNYSEQIVKMLGVDFNEKFEVKKSGVLLAGLFCIDEVLCVWQSNDDGKYYQSGIVDIYDILTYECEIVKIPWKPRNNESYFYILGEITDSCIFYRQWTNTILDLTNFKAGNCFKTRDEAEAHIKELYEKLKEEYEEA